MNSGAPPKPPPPSMGSERARSVFGLVWPPPRKPGGEKFGMRAALGLLRWHMLAGAAIAVLFALLDIASYRQDVSLVNVIAATKLGNLLTPELDRTFITLLAFLSVDGGAVLALNLHKLFGVSHAYSAVRALKAYLFLSLALAIAMSPAVIRFSTTLPVYSIWGIGNYVFYFVAAKAFLILALGGLGGLAALAGIFADSNGAALNMRLMLLLPLVPLSAYFDAGPWSSSNPLQVILASLNSGRLSRLIVNPPSTGLNLDLSISTGPWVSLALLVATVFGTLAVCAVAMWGVWLAASRFVEKSRLWPGISVALSSGLVWTVTAFIFITASPFANVSAPDKGAYGFPGPLAALSGFGLAVALGWIWTRRGRHDLAGDEIGWDGGFAVLTFMLPGAFFVSQIGALGIVKDVTWFALTACWTILFASGLLLVFLAARYFHRSSAISVSTLAALSIVLVEAGGYGTGSAAHNLWKSLDPYPTILLLLTWLNDLGAYASLALILFFVAVSFLAARAFEGRKSPGSEPGV